MWSVQLSLFTFTAIIVHGICARSHNLHFTKHSLHARSLITPDELGTSYDYIIAGGGLAGLVIASRLSEDSSKSILVLEAGDSGDDVAPQVDTPSGAYYSSIVGTSYDWQHVTVPQTNISGRIVGWPRGKILGGSSAMNAMYFVRPSADNFDAWESIIPQDDNAKNWGWDNMYAAMKKSETFTPPLDSVQQTGNIQYNASAYGTNGPMNVSYPGIMMAINGNWTTSLEAVGIPTLQNPNEGVTLGGFITPSSINPLNWTRSYSKSAYIDNLPPRSNLHILTNATVLRVNFNDILVNGKWVASSVSFAGDSTDTVRTVYVVKDVILAGGPLGSPKILMLSGVGPRDVLEAAGVDVVYELPGVGQNLQDHVTAAVVWESPFETAGNIQQSGSDFSRSPEFLSFVNDAVAFVNLSTLFGDEAGALMRAAVINDLEPSSATLVPSQYQQVIEGYKAMYNTTANFTNSSAQLEMLMSVMSPGTIGIQAALQHPFSRGRVYINSSNPFDPIIIDPQYLSHWADVVSLRQGVKLVRTVGQAFGASLGSEITPGPAVQTDDQIEAWLRSGAVGTQYHPTATCSMLSESQGGVVNNLLHVYGLSNVRVADSSVYPFEFAAHLGSVTYGLAEQASVLFRTESSSVVISSSIRMIIVICVSIHLLR